MNLYRLKVFVIHAAGTLAGYLSLLGCHPFALAWMSACYMQDPYRYSVVPAILLGVALKSGMEGALHYGLAMLLTLGLATALEWRQRRLSRYTMGLLTWGVLLLVCFMDGSRVVIALPEGLMIFALTVLLEILLTDFLKDGEDEPETDVIHGPGKERLRESAMVFRRLSECFSQMAAAQEGFTGQDRDRMAASMEELCCKECERYSVCWREHRTETLRSANALFAALENDTDSGMELEQGLFARCIRLNDYLIYTKEVFRQNCGNLQWYNRLAEHRQAVAGQLAEMASMVDTVARLVYESPEQNRPLQEQIDRMLFKLHIKVKKTSVTRRAGRQEIYITMRALGRRCISAREIARLLSRITGKTMVPHPDSRRLVNASPVTILFVEEAPYQVLHGVAKSAKPGESVSGDSDTFLALDQGLAVGCIADGMGSGPAAARNSQMVMELLEQFLEAGFREETAVDMINSTLVLMDGTPGCSTIDVCSADLYEGTCRFLKLGGTASYICRKNEVEPVEMDTLPMAVCPGTGGGVTRQLREGDMVVLVSDGIPEAFGGSKEKMKALLVSTLQENPGEFAKNILAGALRECDYDPKDDMTVLVMGIWKKNWHNH